VHEEGPPVSDEKPIKLRPVYAAINALLSTVCFSTNFMLIKVLNTIEPTVSPFLLVTLDALICCVLLTPVAAKITKTSVITSLTEPFKKLSKKTFAVGLGHICFIMMIIFVCMRSLPIVSVSIFLNLGPLLTVILAVCVLKEKTNAFTIIQTIISFIGVIFIVIGHTSNPHGGSSAASTEAAADNHIFLYGLLIITPVIIAFGNFDASKISQHSSVEMHFIPWWGNALCVIFFGLTCIF